MSRTTRGIGTAGSDDRPGDKTTPPRLHPFGSKAAPDDQVGVDRQPWGSLPTGWVASLVTAPSYPVRAVPDRAGSTARVGIRSVPGPPSLSTDRLTASPGRG